MLPLKDIGERETLTPGDLTGLISDVFQRAGLSPDDAGAVGLSICRAEQAGLRRVGLGLVPHMIEHLRCGRVNATPVPVLSETGPATLDLDADGGFACPPLASAMQALTQVADRQGVAFLSLRNAYPLGSVLAFQDVCAAQGMMGIASFSGLEPRAAANGGLVMTIAPRCVGLPMPCETPSGMWPVTPQRPDMPDETLPFEGPLGAPFRLTHQFIVLRRGLWPGADVPDITGTAAAINAGIAVPAGLLEKIINA